MQMCDLTSSSKDIDENPIKVTGTVKNQFNGECDDNVQQKASLCVDKELFGGATNGLNWFNTADSNTGLDVLNPMDDEKRSDITIKASKEISFGDSSICLNFAINDNKTHVIEQERYEENSRLRLLDQENSDVSVQTSFKLGKGENDAKLHLELGAPNDKGQDGSSLTNDKNTLNRYHLGAAIQVGKNTVGIKELIGDDARQKIVVRSNLDKLPMSSSHFALVDALRTDDNGEKSTMCVQAELDISQGFDADYELWGYGEVAEQSEDGWNKYVKIHVDNTPTSGRKSGRMIPFADASKCKVAFGTARFANEQMQEYCEIEIERDTKDPEQIEISDPTHDSNIYLTQNSTTKINVACGQCIDIC